MKSHDLSNEQLYTVLSACWILSCNDENPIITYRGITHRLNLSESFDVRSFIQEHGELFRQGVSQVRLDALKDDFKRG